MTDNRTCRANSPAGSKHRYSDRQIDGKALDDAVCTITDDGPGADVGGDHPVATETLPNARSRPELEAALGAARQADGMESVLLSTVCHELRTPLTAIKGLTNALLDYEDRLEQTEKREFLAGIDEASDRLAAMIDKLLAFSLLDAGMLPMRPTPTRADEVVSLAVAQLGLRASGRHITLMSPPKLPMAMVDADGLCQVLDNLLVNALKYTPVEAGIRVECSELALVDDSEWAEIPGSLMVSLAREMGSFPPQYQLVIVDGVTNLASYAEDRDILQFFSSCKRLAGGGRAVVVVTQSHAMDNGMLARLRSLCDSYLKLHIERVGAKRATTLKVVKVNSEDLETTNTISFEVLPGVGMHSLSFAKFRA